MTTIYRLSLLVFVLLCRLTFAGTAPHHHYPEFTNNTHHNLHISVVDQQCVDADLATFVLPYAKGHSASIKLTSVYKGKQCLGQDKTLTWKIMSEEDGEKETHLQWSLTPATDEEEYWVVSWRDVTEKPAYSVTTDFTDKKATTKIIISEK